MKYSFLKVIGMLGTTVLGVGLFNAPACMAAPWGIVDAYVEESPDYSTITSSNHMHFALHKFLTDTPIRYAIHFDEYPGQTPDTDLQWEQQVMPLIEQAFASWPQQTLAFVENAGRKKEFKDIFPLLKRHNARLERTTTQQADILFDFSNYKGAALSFNTQNLQEQKRLRLPNPAYFGEEEMKKIPVFLLHEVGHYYGLGDRYQEGISGNSPTYSSTGDTDSNSIMASSLGTQLTCDDVDGFINLLDITLFLNRHQYSPRAKKGWASFCSRDKMYAQAKELNRAALFDGNYIYRFNVDGTVKSKKEARVNALYNPFAETHATRGSFNAVQYFSSTEYTMNTEINYTHWADQKTITAKTSVANLDYLHAQVTHQLPNKWHISFNYLRDARGAKDNKQYNFSLQHMPQACKVTASKYIGETEQLQAALGAGTGQLTAKANLRDGGNLFEMELSGTLEQTRYQVTVGNDVYKGIFKDNQFFLENEEDWDLDTDIAMPLFEGTSYVHRFLKTAQSLCRYTAAVSQANGK